MSANLIISLNLDNDCFADGNLEAEVSRILAELAAFIGDNYIPSAKALRDINGNHVGSVEYEPED